jgi:hypothetical protein
MLPTPFRSPSWGVQRDQLHLPSLCFAGLENYTCIEYVVRSYANNPEGPAASFSSADALFLVTSQSEKFYAQVLHSQQLRTYRRGAAVPEQSLCTEHANCHRICTDTVDLMLAVGL